MSRGGRLSPKTRSNLGDGGCDWGKLYAQCVYNVITTGMLRGRCSFIYVCLVVCEQYCGLTCTFSDMLWECFGCVHSDYVLYVVDSPSHSLRLWIVGRCCGGVMWVCGLRGLFVWWVWEEHKRVPMTD